MLRRWYSIVFEQNFHVAHRLQRYGAPPPTRYEEATPERLADEMRHRLRTKVVYRPIERGGALAAARWIAPLVGG